MAHWHLFFLRLQQSSSCIGNQKITPRIIDKCYLSQIWLAYKSSIYNALPIIESKLDYLPSKVEKLFGLSWARLLNLISMTRKNTNLYETVQNQRKFLPHRMLQESDRTLHSNDLPESVNKSLKVLFAFRFDWLSFIEKIWQKLTCNYEARTYAQYTLETMAVSKFVASRYLAKATMNSFLFECDHLSYLEKCDS